MLTEALHNLQEDDAWIRDILLVILKLWYCYKGIKDLCYFITASLCICTSYIILIFGQTLLLLK